MDRAQAVGSRQSTRNAKNPFSSAAESAVNGAGDLLATPSAKRLLVGQHETSLVRRSVHSSLHAKGIVPKPKIVAQQIGLSINVGKNLVRDACEVPYKIRVSSCSCKWRCGLQCCLCLLPLASVHSQLRQHCMRALSSCCSRSLAKMTSHASKLLCTASGLLEVPEMSSCARECAS